MNIMPYSGGIGLVTIGLKPGELLLESIKKAIESRGIRNGAVVACAGTLKTCRMHYVEHTGFPPKDRFFTLSKPLELLSLSGLIAGGDPHLHVVVSCGENEVYGGHLEEGSEVLYLTEVAILVFNEHRMARSRDNEWKINLLGPEGER